MRGLKTSLCIALVSIALYTNSALAMKKEICEDERKAKKLANSWQRRNAIEILEMDWKKGGQMAQFYPLNEYNFFCKGNILSAALRKKKSADFIGYLIQSGADVLLEWSAGWDIEGPNHSPSYCSPIALASLYGDPDTVRTIIECGGLKNTISYVRTNKPCSLLIRYMREAKIMRRNTIENYVTCLESLIKAGCAVQQSDAFHLLDNSGCAYLEGWYYGYSDKFTTPLMEAIRLKVPEFVELLLKHGADPDKKYNDKSARDFAQEKGLLQNIKLLIKPKQEKNILERALDKIKADEDKIIEEERLQQKAAQEALAFKEEKRLLGSVHLQNYVKINTDTVQLERLLILNRT
jgi:hypothetical protein